MILIGVMSETVGASKSWIEVKTRRAPVRSMVFDFVAKSKAACNQDSGVR